MNKTEYSMTIYGEKYIIYPVEEACCDRCDARQFDKELSFCTVNCPYLAGWVAELEGRECKIYLAKEVKDE